MFAEEEAALLLAASVPQDSSSPAAHAGRSTPARDLESLIARRVAGEPLEVIVGWAAFCGLRIRVAEGVFVPRRRTEELVAAALATPALLGRSSGAPEDAATVLDLCCGSGAVGAAIEAARPRVRVWAADLDPRATAVAATNLRHPAQVFTGDLYAALPTGLRGRIDVLVANAPYVPSGEIDFLPREARLAEPLAALDGGATGTELHARIAAGAREWLAPGGTVLIETSLGQAAQTTAHLAAAGFSTSIRHSDDTGGTVAVGS